MAQFCTSCGAQIAPGAKFCTGCGAVTPAATVAPAAAPMAAPAPAPAKGSPVLKIVLIVIGVFVLLGAVALVGVVYTGYKVARHVKTAAADRGVDLDALTSSNSVSGRLPDPCSLLSTGEASDILGVKVVSSERSGESCTYHIETLSTEQQQDKIAKAMKEMEAKGKENGDASREVEAMTKALGGAMSGGASVFAIELNRDGKMAVNGMRMAMGMSGVKGATHKVPDLGDDAEMGPLGSMLVFTKRGIGVQIDGRMIAGQEKLIAMAQKVASRI